eukprot:GILJ01005252.1.p1 GENE.GILJ01005252.1~~GILJ01005252.1.p1  ORF type:complete len:356 (+),score=27.39 GILJ01005252.1:43-1110(+)
MAWREEQKRQQLREEQAATRRENLPWEFLPTAMKNRDADDTLREILGIEKSETVEQDRLFSRAAKTDFKVCGECGREIAGPAINAMNQFFHRDCFLCSQCSRVIDTSRQQTFSVKNNLPVCKSCTAFEKKEKEGLPSQPLRRVSVESPRSLGPIRIDEGKVFCSGCGNVVMLNGVQPTPGQFWHEECFTCGVCSQIIRAGPEGFKKEGMSFIHPSCSKSTLPSAGSDVCFVCRQTLAGSAVLKLGQKKAHKACFKCDRCNCLIVGSYAEQGSNKYICASCASAPQAAKVTTSVAPASRMAGIKMHHTINFSTGETKTQVLTIENASREAAFQCAKCHTPSNSMDAKFCANCGTRF